MPDQDETNTQYTPTDIDQTAATDTPVTEVDVPTDVATDTPVNVTDGSVGDASSAPIDEPVDVPAPAESAPAPVAPVEAPVAAAPVVVPAPDKFSQNQSLWRHWLEKAVVNHKQKRVNNINKVFQFVAKRKKTTVRDV